MLTVRNICKTFMTRKPAITVLHDISFTVQEQEFVSLLGASGCGKTTLLTLIAGFQEPTSGEMYSNKKRIVQPGPDRGFVFQNYALFPWLTLKQNVQFPMKELGLLRSQREELTKQLFVMAQLEGNESLYPNQISGGMKQRVAFIRAMAGNPDMLLLDEPLGAVDPQMRKTLQTELEAMWLHNKTTVLMVTHDIDESVYLSDRVLILAPCRNDIIEEFGTNLIAEIDINLPRPRNRGSEAYWIARNAVEDSLISASMRT